MNPAAPHSGTPGAAHVKRSVPGTYSPAPHHPNRANAEGYDGYPSKPNDCAGWAKMRGRFSVHAGRGPHWPGMRTKQSQAVTFSHSVRRAVQPPRALRAPDGIGRGLSGFLPLLSRARHLLLQETVSPCNARLKHRQEPGRVCRVVVPFIPFRVAALHVPKHGAKRVEEIRKAVGDFRNVQR